MTKIKICGLTRSEDITIVNQYKPDYIGFVFARSKRQITFSQADMFRDQLDSGIGGVGVFVDHSQAEICDLVQKGIIDIIQLHGAEDRNYIEELRQKVSCPILKAIRVTSPEQIIEAQHLPVSHLLLDTYIARKMGGSGEVFDWGLIPSDIKPYFLAGGLQIHNIQSAISTYKPYCVDVSSGVETNQIKNADKVSAFIKAVREEQ